MSNDFDAAVNAPVIAVSPVTLKVFPSNLKLTSPFTVLPPVAVST
jgi:hypothetical protein